MFYCDPCATHKDLPRAKFLSRGTCEICRDAFSLGHKLEDEKEDDKLPQNIPDSRFNASFDAIFGKS